MRVWRLRLAGLLVVAAIGLTACTDLDFPQPQKTANASASPSAMPKYPEYCMAACQEAVDYMRSDARVNRYKAAWGAAEKVARALETGKLGAVDKYTGSKLSDLTPGYIGWGGIATQDKRFYAWVWWNANGTIDYSKGIQGFAANRLLIESVDPGTGPYRVDIPYDTHTDVVDARSVGLPWSIAHYGQFREPTTLADLKALDNTVFVLLSRYMIDAGLA